MSATIQKNEQTAKQMPVFSNIWIMYWIERYIDNMICPKKRIYAYYYIHMWVFSILLRKIMSYPICVF